MSADDVIYFAGLFDGEGSISIIKSKPNLKRRMISDRYYLSISLGSIDYGIINWLSETFGGNVSGEKTKTKPMYRWYLASVKAAEILKLLYPYLKIKKWQAKYAIDFQDQCGGYCGRKGLSEEQLTKRKAFRQIMKEAKNVYGYGCARRPREEFKSLEGGSGVI